MTRRSLSLARTPLVWREKRDEARGRTVMAAGGDDTIYIRAAGVYTCMCSPLMAVK